MQKGARVILVYFENLNVFELVLLWYLEQEVLTFINPYINENHTFY